MSRIRQKLRERKHLERFRATCAVFPAGDISESECPDFLVATNHGILGIEHRDYHWDEKDSSGSPLRQQENLRQKVLWNAIRIYESRGLPHLDVRVDWSTNHYITSKREKELRTILVDLVTSHLPEQNGCILIECPSPDWEKLPEEITAVRIARFDGLSGNHWNFSRGGYLQEATVNQLHTLITEKEQKLPTYRFACPAGVWLLIVADGSQPSSLIEPNAAMTTFQFETAFDRVFFFQYFEGTSNELFRSGVIR